MRKHLQRHWSLYLAGTLVPCIVWHATAGNVGELAFCTFVLGQLLTMWLYEF